MLVQINELLQDCAVNPCAQFDLHNKILLETKLYFRIFVLSFGYLEDGPI
jgi:hypothetical protein